MLLLPQHGYVNKSTICISILKGTRASPVGKFIFLGMANAFRIAQDAIYILIRYIIIRLSIKINYTVFSTENLISQNKTVCRSSGVKVYHCWKQFRPVFFSCYSRHLRVRTKQNTSRLCDRVRIPARYVGRIQDFVSSFMLIYYFMTRLNGANCIHVIHHLKTRFSTRNVKWYYHIIK